MKKLITPSLAVILAASLSACGASKTETSASTSTTPAKSNEPVTIRVPWAEGEASNDLLAEFEKANPNIKLSREVLTADKLAAQIAANDAPDIIGINGVQQLPSYVIRGVALDLTPYFKKSTIFKEDNILPVADVYRFDGKNVGQGPRYGFPKDWSPDYTVWYNKKLFAAAGVPVPDANTPMTWNQFFDLAKKLTIKNGDAVTQYGFVKSGNTEADMGSIMQYMLSKGIKLSTDDFSKIDFTKPELKQIVNMWADVVKSNVGPNSVNNLDKGVPNLDLFLNGKSAMILKGYWFNSQITSNANTKTHLDDFGMLPAPIAEGGNRVSPTGSATGGIINKNSKHKEEAWKVFEWFYGGKAAEDRAKTGFGVPALKSLIPLMPQQTDFDKRVYAALQNELKYSDKYLEWNPYLIGPDGILAKHLPAFYFNKASIDDTLANINKDSNTIIQEAKSAAGK